jgi:hypothetical protein
VRSSAFYQPHRWGYFIPETGELYGQTAHGSWEKMFGFDKVKRFIISWPSDGLVDSTTKISILVY